MKYYAYPQKRSKDNPLHLETWSLKKDHGDWWIKDSNGETVAEIIEHWTNGKGSTIAIAVHGIGRYERLRREFHTAIEAYAFIEGLEQAERIHRGLATEGGHQARVVALPKKAKV